MDRTKSQKMASVIDVFLKISHVLLIIALVALGIGLLIMIFIRNEDMLLSLGNSILRLAGRGLGEGIISLQYVKWYFILYFISGGLDVFCTFYAIRYLRKLMGSIKNNAEFDTNSHIYIRNSAIIVLIGGVVSYILINVSNRLYSAFYNVSTIVDSNNQITGNLISTSSEYIRIGMMLFILALVLYCIKERYGKRQDTETEKIEASEEENEQ